MGFGKAVSNGFKVYIKTYPAIFAIAVIILSIFSAGFGVVVVAAAACPSTVLVVFLFSYL